MLIYLCEITFTILIIEINKDIEKYQESVAMGLVQSSLCIPSLPLGADAERESEKQDKTLI
ncbi:MAG: hypothetical protein K2P65_09145 [Lachnospiraceae bacterium]|nr:hypothetical protein [Lachnospiraceae bacterium]